MMQAVKTRLKHNEELALININRVRAVIFKLKGCMLGICGLTI